jgi:hypothetical protein
MEEYTKEQLVAKLDEIINAKEASWQELALLVFHPHFPEQFFEEAVKELEQALAEHKTRLAQQRAQSDL